ncbi:hypothetical protein Tco_1193706 [Tanacetum coccineum]
MNAQKKETGDGLYVKRRSEILSNEEVKWVRQEGKHDQNSDSSNDEGSAYFGEALVVVENDEITELVMNSGDNRTCTMRETWKVKIELHDGSSSILEDVRYVSGLRRSLISLGTLKKEGYTMKMQKGRVSVIKELQGSQGNHEVKVIQDSNDDAALAQRMLEDKQLELKANTDCLVKEHRKVQLCIKVGADIMVTGVPGQEGNVAEKKKVKESMEANLRKLLKYNA